MSGADRLEVVTSDQAGCISRGWLKSLISAIDFRHPFQPVIKKPSQQADIMKNIL